MVSAAFLDFDFEPFFIFFDFLLSLLGFTTGFTPFATLSSPGTTEAGTSLRGQSGWGAGSGAGSLGNSGAGSALLSEPVSDGGLPDDTATRSYVPSDRACGDAEALGRS